MISNNNFKPISDDETKRCAYALASEIAERVSRSDQPGGELSSLATGRLGLALLYAGLMQVDADRWSGRLAQTIREIVSEPIKTIGLFTGVMGVASVVKYINIVSGSFSKGLAKLQAQILEIASELSLARPFPADFRELDVISGIAGIAIALNFQDTTVSKELAFRLNAYLIDYLESTAPDAWHTLWIEDFVAHRAVFSEERFINFGLAHGVAGILHSVTQSTGDGAISKTSLNRIAMRLSSYAYQDGEFLQFPCAKNESETKLGRMAWCYGLPGTASVIERSARLAGNEQLAAEMRSALMVLCKPKDPAWRIKDVAICHGLAGIGLVVNSMPGFIGAEASSRYAALLLDGFEAEAQFCYKYFGIGGEFVDDASFLTGSLGVATTLLTLTRQMDPRWTKIFALSGEAIR